MLAPATERLIDLALDEDLALGDLTGEAIFPPGHHSRGCLHAKQDLVLCGSEVARRVFARVDPAITAEPLVPDGTRLAPGQHAFRLAGPTRGLLAAERTALNFLQRLSGIATAAARHVAAAGGRIQVVDTRKTAPGWRALEKYAVRCGGARNHRGTLGEHVLIKDNHLAAAGSIRAAVEACRARAPHGARIEVEVTTLAQLDEALAARAEIVLLDNLSPDEVRAAVVRTAGRALLEISGGVTLATLPAYAATGADFVSIGALTHSAPAVDLSLELEPAP